jgi:hypothetical protein
MKWILTSAPYSSVVRIHHDVGWLEFYLNWRFFVGVARPGRIMHHLLCYAADCSVCSLWTQVVQVRSAHCATLRVHRRWHCELNARMLSEVASLSRGKLNQVCRFL